MTTQAYISPADFTYWVAEDGLPTKGGKVKLNKYMSASDSNGGSYTSQDLISKLDYLMTKVGGKPTFKNYIRIGMGQGDINDFIALWDWMYDNLDEVRKLKVQTYSVIKNPDGEGFIKVRGKILNLADVFSERRPFPDAMGELIANGCFGWDCIGFVSQYLVAIGHLSEYPTWYPDDYHTHGKFKPIFALDHISPCSVIVFGRAHIVLVNGVDYVLIEDNVDVFVAKVSVSQSYSSGGISGPQSRYSCILRQPYLGNDKWGPINQTGVIDKETKCTVGKHADIQVCYPPYVAA